MFCLFCLCHMTVEIHHKSGNTSLYNIACSACFVYVTRLGFQGHSVLPVSLTSRHLLLFHLNNPNVIPCAHITHIQAPPVSP